MPWWGKSSSSTDSKPAEPEPTSNSKAQPPFDADKLPDRQKLPKGLQNIVDKSDQDSSFFDDVKEG
jgi:mitochondrial fission process protein 1